jgi:hypothetical protein
MNTKLTAIREEERNKAINSLKDKMQADLDIVTTQ